MAQKGILAVVSGFSGAGKGTLMKALLASHPEQYALSISATTRSPRAGEEHGREYFFLSKEEFEGLIARDALIEYACYVGNYYGTPRAYVLEQMAAGKVVILEIEIQGARKIKKQFPEAVLLFVTTKNAQVLKERLSRRGTETQEFIDQRLERAVQESEGIEEYDYLVVNDELETCVEEIHAIIESEHRRLRYHMELVRKVREELRGLLKGE